MQVLKEVKSGGQHKTPPNEETSLTHHCTKLNKSENFITNYIEAQDRIRPVRHKTLDYHPLDIIVKRNMQKGSCMKLMGYVTYFTHKWIDKLYLKKHKNCEHTYHCQCKE